jgi:hypothetical protein
MVDPSVSVIDGSIRFYCSNTKETDPVKALTNPYALDTPRDEAGDPIPYAEGTYILQPKWDYIAYTPNADLFDSTTTYDTDDLVSYDGAVYKSLVDSNDDLPTVEASWEFVERPYVDIPAGLYEPTA